MQNNDVIHKNHRSSVSTELLSRLLGPLADEMGEYIADRFRRWRWRRDNLRKIAEKYEMERKARNIDSNDPAFISQGDAYRLVESCSLDDEEIIQELWAGLITSAMHPKKTVEIKAFIDILKALSPVEIGLILILDKYEHPLRHSFNTDLGHADLAKLNRIRKEIYQKNKKWERELDLLAERIYRHFQSERREIAVQNLFRLRCIGLRSGRNLDRDTSHRGLPFGVSAADTSPTYEAYANTVDYLDSLILAGSGTGGYEGFPILRQTSLLQQVPELRFQLTQLGRMLISSSMTQELREKINSFAME